MNDNIYIIIAKTLEGEATDADRRELEAWLALDEKNRTEYEETKRLWQNADDLFAAPQFDTTAAWNKVAAKTTLAAPSASPEQETRRKSRTIAFPQLLRYSSAAAAVLIIGFFGYRMWNQGTVSVVASADAEVIELPDHSKVTLRKGSRLEYRRTFASAQRDVKLEGEAFFEVTRNEAQPFVIDAQSVAVKVLGTSFNVLCSDTAAHVTVATGKVQVTAQETQKQVILTPGEQGDLSAGSLSETTITDSNYIYWKTGVLKFNETPLTEVVATISKAKDTLVQLEPTLPEAVKQALITTRFTNQSISAMLTELCALTKTRWYRKGNTYFIGAK